MFYTFYTFYMFYMFYMCVVYVVYALLYAIICCSSSIVVWRELLQSGAWYMLYVLLQYALATATACSARRTPSPVA